MNAKLLRPIMRLASLALDFGRINRATYHQDGKTPESDTDHTVMLSLIACSLAYHVNGQRAQHLAASLRDDTEISVRLLDVGMVAQYALVHDLVEVYAGDTATLNISEENRRSKEIREAKALSRLCKEFEDLPWLSRLLRDYESLVEPEARFVKVVDKAMPKLANLLNGGAGYRSQISDVREVVRLNLVQQEKIKDSYGCDQPEAVDLLIALSDEVAAMAQEWEDIRPDKTLWAVDETAWRDFPTAVEIRKQLRWLRLEPSGKVSEVHLEYYDQDLVDSTGDGPPLTLLYGDQKKHSGDVPLDRYRKSKWQPRR